jgi:hypothetical protein
MFTRLAGPDVPFWPMDRLAGCPRRFHILGTTSSGGSGTDLAALVVAKAERRPSTV